MKNRKSQLQLEDFIIYTVRIWGQSLLCITVASTLLLAFLDGGLSFSQIIMSGIMSFLFAFLASIPVFIFMVVALIFIRKLDWPKIQQKLLFFGIYLVLMVSLIFFFSGTKENLIYYVSAISVFAVIPALIILKNPLPISNKEPKVQVPEGILDDDLINENSD